MNNTIELDKQIQAIEDQLHRLKKERSKVKNIKFILILPKNIRDYLDWKSKTYGVDKSEIVRNALEMQIDSDSKYINEIVEA